MSPLRSALVIAIAVLMGSIAGLMFGYLTYHVCPNFLETAFRRTEVPWTPWETAGGYGVWCGAILGIVSGWVIVVADALRSGRDGA